MGRSPNGELAGAMPDRKGPSDEDCWHPTLRSDTRDTHWRAGQPMFTALLPEPSSYTLDNAQKPQTSGPTGAWALHPTPQNFLRLPQHGHGYLQLLM